MAPVRLIVLVMVVAVAASAAEPDPRRRPREWPFVIPAVAGPSSSPVAGQRLGLDPGRRVFAHYLPCFARSFDNAPPDQDYYAREYLTPGGEGGKWRAAGGFLRQRPLPRAPQSGATWKREDLRWEVRCARALGIDGFCIDLLDLHGPLWQVAVDLAEVAAEEGNFAIVPMPDMDALADEAQALPEALKSYAAIPSVLRLDGALVVAPYNAQKRSAAWWQDTLAALKDGGTPAVLWPVLQHTETHWADFAAVSIGLSEWGERVPALQDHRADLAAKANAIGRAWMQTVAPQDSRPKEGVAREAEGSRLLREGFDIARRTGSAWIQLVTWNDFSEGSAICPTDTGGWVYADLVAYHSAWFKQGQPPPITRDGLYLIHRTQPSDLVPGDTATKPFRFIPPGSATDQVEAIAFLTAPAQVVVHCGDQERTRDLPAGLGTVSVDLAPGRPWAEIRRPGRLPVRLESAWTVVSQAAIADPLYHATGPALGGR